MPMTCRRRWITATEEIFPVLERTYVISTVVRKRDDCPSSSGAPRHCTGASEPMRGCTVPRDGTDSAAYLRRYFENNRW